MGTIYFGRIAVGKSTVVKKIHGNDFIDCDKSIWNHHRLPREWVKSRFREAIESGDKDEYRYLLRWFVKSIDMHNVFLEDTNYEVSVFGNYYNQLLIPSCIADRFNLVKVSCSTESRERNIESRGLDCEWVDKCDYMYEDPSVWFETIYIEDY